MNKTDYHAAFIRIKEEESALTFDSNDMLLKTYGNISAALFHFTKQVRRMQKFHLCSAEKIAQNESCHKYILGQIV